MTEKVVHFRTGSSITTRDPDEIRAEYEALAERARCAGWPDEFGPQLDQLRVEFHMALREREQADLMSWPLTPYDIEAFALQVRDAPNLGPCTFPPLTLYPGGDPLTNVGDGAADDPSDES